ncbi:MAG: prepilin-type N-terminal cleavage/methylation domain-containing protein [Clostridiales bacterium]|nr:prepilin-type N-terminal cleavage/methylation domain-containing protein [Clostridiales bacterium]
MKNDKGFSLVEIIVVLAMLVILSSIIIINTDTTGKRALNSCVNSINNNLSDTKVSTLSGRDIELKLFMSDGNVILNKGRDDNLGKFDVTLHYEDIDGENLGSEELNSAGITITFKSNTGEYNEVKSGKYLSKIVVSKGSIAETIICQRLTGKNYIQE